MEHLEFRSGKSFEIGPITVEPSQNILRYGTEIFALEPKIMDVLEYLACHQGKVCSRDDMIAAIWNVKFGADESLTRAISVIRKTFRKAGGKAEYIQTISKRGYILQEPVSTASAPTPKPVRVAAPPKIIKNKKHTPSDVAPPVSQIRAADPPKKTKTIKKTSTLFIMGGMIAAAIIFVWQPWQPLQSFGSQVAVSPFGRSVAVMPFVDLSEGKDHQYFSDGIAEELSNELGKIESLRVVGLRSGRASEYESLTYTEMGGRLKVSHIIHGSVRKQENHIRITAQLINTEDNSHAWSSNYDGTLKDMFDLQQRVAFDAGTELSLLLSLEFDEPIDIREYTASALMPAAE